MKKKGPWRNRIVGSVKENSLSEVWAEMVAGRGLHSYTSKNPYDVNYSQGPLQIYKAQNPSFNP